MKSKFVGRVFGVIALVSCLAVTGCDDNPLKKFVEQDVKLDVSKADAAGKIEFRELSYSTAYRQVCDYYECGGYERYCEPGRQVCTGGGQVCTPVKRCTADGCTTDTVCHTTPGSCYREPGSCYDRYVSRSCARNCREEPYTITHVEKVNSPIRVVVKGADDVKSIKGLHLGVKTNSTFVAAFDNASLRPDGFAFLWDQLKRDQKTVLVSQAKGLKLVADQNFLTLPVDFVRGQPVTIEALFERDTSTSDKGTVSAVGTAVDLPSLEYDRH